MTTYNETTTPAVERVSVRSDYTGLLALGWEVYPDGPRKAAHLSFWRDTDAEAQRAAAAIVDGSACARCLGAGSVRFAGRLVRCGCDR